MEEFSLPFENGDPVILEKLRSLLEICYEIFCVSPDILKKGLEFVLKKHSISILDEYGCKEVVTCNIGTQTDYDDINTDNNQSTSDWNCDNIADVVASLAESNLEQNGFVFDHASGLYYDYKTQCYYNPEFKLYYYPQTGSYYYYDEESGGLKFYCTAASEVDNSSSSANNAHNPAPIKEPSSPTKKEEWGKSHEYEKEEGECSESDEEPVPSPGPSVIEAGPKAFVPDHSKHIAPCMRVLVKSSLLNSPSPGTLFIVTCMGGTLGREGDHDVLIPDELVSKLHSSFQYVYKDGFYFYEITDMGSKNGTFLNGKRLSDSLVESKAFEIPHGSILRVGNTDLLCHIHEKSETCQECVAFSLSHEEGKQDLASGLTLREKYNNEISVIRKKFGIMNSPVVKYPEGYEDKADSRRRAIGSSHPSEKTQSSSIDVSIDKKNKGFALMTKMGWVEGTGIGKNEGMKEPISLDSNEGKLGLGCEEALPKSKLKKSKKLEITKKTLNRFNKI